jgi:uncharacterized protein
MLAKFCLSVLFLLALCHPLSAEEAEAPADLGEADTLPERMETGLPDEGGLEKELVIDDGAGKPTAVSIDLKEVVEPPSGDTIFPQLPPEEVEPLEEGPGTLLEDEIPVELPQPQLVAGEAGPQRNTTRQLLGVEIPPATSTRLTWKPSASFTGMAVDTPVLVVNGANDGPTLCLTAAIHGDELNGIEMVRRVMYDLDPDKLNGMVVGVPIVNLLGFSRSSRYLPDRRDLNRYFPGNPRGSVASRLAYAFFHDVIKHCSELVDLHTGSFHRTNIPQLRADLHNPQVEEFVELFGDIPVLNTSGNRSSLRAAAVRAGIPTVTLEVGEPMRMQRDMVEVGVKAIRTLMDKNGMYAERGLWIKPSPAFYRSAWVRANASGILLSGIKLGAEVKKGDILGEINNPISNEQLEIVSPYQGRILGMALDQYVMPGFAIYHIGIHAPKGEQVAREPAAGEPGFESMPPPTGESQDVLEKLQPIMPEEEGFDDE